MAFKYTHSNPLPDLVELHTRIADPDSAEIGLDVELRIHPSNIDDEFSRLHVEFTEVTLSMDLEGLTVVPQTKFGEPVVGRATRRIIRETTTSSTVHFSVEIPGQFSVEINSHCPDPTTFGGRAAVPMNDWEFSASTFRVSSFSFGSIIANDVAICMGSCWLGLSPGGNQSSDCHLIRRNTERKLCRN